MYVLDLKNVSKTQIVQVKHYMLSYGCIVKILKYMATTS